MKQIRLNLQEPEVLTFRRRLQSHSVGLQSALQMINVVLALEGNSLQDVLAHSVEALRLQLNQIAEALHISDNGQIKENLRSLAKAGQSLYSSASTVLSESGKSVTEEATITAVGVGLEKHSGIQEWISAPSRPNSGPENHREPTQPTTGGGNKLRRADRQAKSSDDESSDGDDDIDKAMSRRFAREAQAGFLNGHFAVAELNIKKCIDRLDEATESDEVLLMMSMRLALIRVMQSDWTLLEEVIEIKELSTSSLSLHFECGYILALKLSEQKRFDAALTFCKAALNGQRRLLGRRHINSVRSTSLLAMIYRGKGEDAEAQACAWFLPEGHKDFDCPSPTVYIRQHAERLWKGDPDRIATGSPKLESPRKMTAHRAASDGYVTKDALTTSAESCWRESGGLFRRNRISGHETKNTASGAAHRAATEAFVATRPLTQNLSASAAAAALRSLHNNTNYEHDANNTLTTSAESRWRESGGVSRRNRISGHEESESDMSLHGSGFASNANSTIEVVRKPRRSRANSMTSQTFRAASPAQTAASGTTLRDSSPSRPLSRRSSRRSSVLDTMANTLRKQVSNLSLRSEGKDHTTRRERRLSRGRSDSMSERTFRNSATNPAETSPTSSTSLKSENFFYPKASPPVPHSTQDFVGSGAQSPARREKKRPREKKPGHFDALRYQANRTI